MREKELRLALVCYGGVSLAVYMHGITKEIWKLLRASAARTGPGDMPGFELSDSEIVYRELLEAISGVLDLRVLVDIVAGASAGGINGILLAHAIAGGHDMEQLRDLWLDNADVDRLLDPAATAQRWSKWWATPLVWYARGKGYGMADDVVDPQARREVRAKLSQFMRSRWFRPPFSGLIFTRMLYDALLAMAAGKRGPVLIPPGLPLDLFVTVTDFHGSPEYLRLHSPLDIVETEHRLIIDFHSGAAHADMPRTIGDPAELAFAARATASFPGAFPPAQVGEIDAVVREQARQWPGRTAFLTRIFPRRAATGQPFENATLIDGSVLNSRPFGPAIEALSHRPAHREVDRRFVYIDPKPGRHGVREAQGRPPGFFTTILRSLADIPREQPIRDNLEAIEALSARVRRLRYVVDGMQPQVDAAIERAIGTRFFFSRLTPERLSDWRSRAQTVAAREAGFAYGAYGQLKLAQVVESIAARLIELGEFGMRGMRTDGVRGAVWHQVRSSGWDQVAEAGTRGGARSDFVVFLRRFDLDFRIRRLRFLLRRLNGLALAQTRPEDRRATEAIKTALYQLLAPYLERRRPGFYSLSVRRTAATADHDPVAALDEYEVALDLRTLDIATDARLVEVLGMAVGVPMRRALLRAYLGFPFYDIAMLPLLQGDGIDEFDEIKVDRISPDDAVAIRKGAATLKGTQFNAFGAFFSRAYRENDYLWGRLHGADRLIDIVLSTLPAGSELPDAAKVRLKVRAFRAILAAERDVLTMVPDLLATLEREIDTVAAGLEPDGVTAVRATG